MKRHIGLFVILALLGVLAANPGRSVAQEPATITVRGLICPAGFAGSNWEAVCAPFADVETSVSLNASAKGYSETTADDGKASFVIDETGPYAIEFGIPGDLADFFSLCGQVGGTEPLPVAGADSNRMIVNVSAGWNVWCTFYVVPFDAVDTASEPQTVADIAYLPNTGSGGVESDSGLTTVGLLLGSALLLAGVGLLTAREELFDRR